MLGTILGSIAGLLVNVSELQTASAPPALGAPVTVVNIPPPVLPSEKIEARPGIPELKQPEWCCPDTRFWVRGEYLLWRTKSPPAPIPLVTANNDPTTIAALNEAGTTVLFGDGSGQSTNVGWMSGGRITLGAWNEDGDRTVGWEASGFLLERRNRGFDFGSAGGAARVVAIPVNATQPFNGNPAGETSLNSGGVANLVSGGLNTRLWGAEANGVVNLYSNRRLHLTGLVGFRYIDLLENLSISEGVIDPAANGIAVAVDGFGTRNQFYAGQIGARAELIQGRWTLDTSVKVAFGSMHQVSNIAGSTTVTNGAFGNPTGTTAGGLFAEPSNIGATSRNVFAVAPEVTFQVGYDLTPRLRSFAGYNFIYMSSVLRPGNQMDRNVNPSQNAFLVPPGTLTGPAAPVPFFRSADFWAQGFNFGLEFRY